MVPDVAARSSELRLRVVDVSHRRRRHEVRAPAGGPQAVDRPVAGDRVQPCRQGARRRVERLCPVPQREERVLHHLFGYPTIRCQPGCRREDRSAMPVIEARQGIERPARDHADESDVVWAAVTVLVHAYGSRASPVSPGVR